MRVGAVPDLAGGLGALVRRHAHALVLDALAREGVRRAGCLEAGGRRHDDLALDAARDVDELGAVVEADAVGLDVDRDTGAYGREEARRPARDAAAGQHLLRGSGDPHAVHDRRAETGEAGSGDAGVDRVVVARDGGESTQVGRRRQRRGTAATCAACPRRRRRSLHRREPGRRARRHRYVRGSRSARAAWRRRLRRTDTVTSTATTRPKPVSSIDSTTDEIVSGGGRERQGAGQRDRVVEVDQVEHALDDGDAVVRRGLAEHGEHRRPGEPDEHVGNRVDRRVRAGDTGVVGDQVRVPVDVDRRAAVRHGRDVATGGTGDERGHRGCGDLGRHDRSGTGEHGVVDLDAQRERTCQRHLQLGGTTVDRDERGAGLGVLGALRVDDDPLGTEAVDGVADGATGPHQVRSGEDEREDVAGLLDAATAGDALGGAARGEQTVDRRVLEAAQQLGDRLVDAVDAGDRDGAGDDADLVGGVARVVRLPQRVRTPPAAYVLVEHRHEVDRLARRTALLDEEQRRRPGAA